ncbi:hypothetical protein NDU88_008638 [Pleurodeles waltl]|uniref:Uncharacterized protein n=1 Tax=Pleurodeles waltl TaxID=8319 RepID=A0AAV7PSS0_PLEWA|nr:hypothetical protein NDU88_008638 [Pleurodeles waltl]
MSTKALHMAGQSAPAPTVSHRQHQLQHCESSLHGTGSGPQVKTSTSARGIPLAPSLHSATTSPATTYPDRFTSSCSAAPGRHVCPVTLKQPSACQPAQTCQAIQKRRSPQGTLQRHSSGTSVRPCTSSRPLHLAEIPPGLQVCPISSPRQSATGSNSAPLALTRATRLPGREGHKSCKSCGVHEGRGSIQPPSKTPKCSPAPGTGNSPGAALRERPDRRSAHTFQQRASQLGLHLRTRNSSASPSHGPPPHPTWQRSPHGPAPQSASLSVAI